MADSTCSASLLIHPQSQTKQASEPSGVSGLIVAIGIEQQTSAIFVTRKSRRRKRLTIETHTQCDWIVSTLTVLSNAFVFLRLLLITSLSDVAPCEPGWLRCKKLVDRKKRNTFYMQKWWIGRKQIACTKSCLLWYWYDKWHRSILHTWS